MSSAATATHDPLNPGGNPLMDAALAYAKRGWRVFPVHSIRNGVCSCKAKGACEDSGKHPRILGNLKAATTDPGQIRRWWTKWPDANIGIATGAESNLVVVDEDPRHCGDESLRALEAEIGRLPDTVMVLTGGGGSHRYFRHPGGHITSHEIYLGLDVKADDGYVVAPPSGHLSGRRYEWELSSHPDDVPLAELPAPLLEILKAPASSTEPGVEGDEVIKSGRRNRTLFRLACSIRRYAGIEIILPAIRTVNAERCKPPLPDDELVKIAEGVVKRYHIEDLAGSNTAAEESPGSSGPSSRGSTTSDGEGRPCKMAVLRPDDIGNGQRFARRYGDRCRYCHASKEWWIWDGKRWKLDDGGRTLSLAKDTARHLLTEAREATEEDRERLAKWAAKCQAGPSVREILRMAESELPVTSDQFDTDPYLLNCANGVLDLDLHRNPDGTLRPHDPELLLSKFTPIEFNPEFSAEGSLWLRFLEQVVPDPEIRDFLQVFSGYSLTGITRERLFVLLYGRGRNGKSTFLDAVREVIGDYARNADINTFLKKQNDPGVRNGLARLAGARMITAVEPPESNRSCFDESILKLFTGGTDKITAAEVYQKEFEYTPQGKLWLATNHEPDVRDTTDSFWDRIIKVPFTVRVEKIDLDLPEKLKGEYPIILTWAWEGLKKWQRMGRVPIPEVLQRETKTYRESTDPVQTWIEDRCVVEAGARDLPRALFTDFRTYAGDAGLGGPRNETAFGRALTDKGFPSKSISKSRFRVGLRLTTTPRQEDLEQQVQQV